MGDVVNLRRARKRKARETAEAAASVNRSLHGVPKSERDTAKVRVAREKRDLDARQLDPERSD